VDSRTCNIRLCVHPSGSNQACRWISDPRTNLDSGVTWIQKQ
jgi:hypothetical protein